MHKAIVAALALAGCQRGAPVEPAAEPPPAEQPAPEPPTTEIVRSTDPGDPDAPAVRRLVATLQPTEGSEVEGTVTLRRMPGGVQVEAEVEGLEPGQRHAWHVHLYGDCSAPDGTSAGPHFNFFGPSNPAPEETDRITGNLGELEAGPDGTVTAEIMLTGVRLLGPHGLLGRSVVVHAEGNDTTQPPGGDAGDRLACGVIGVAEPAS